MNLSCYARGSECLWNLLLVECQQIKIVTLEQEGQPRPFYLFSSSVNLSILDLDSLFRQGMYRRIALQVALAYMTVILSCHKLS